MSGCKSGGLRLEPSGLMSLVTKPIDISEIYKPLKPRGKESFIRILTEAFSYSIPYYHTLFYIVTNMVSLLTRATLALSLTSLCRAQTAKVPQDRFASEIPKEEAAALAAIVEDEPPPPSAQRGGGSSTPNYSLYSVALPIPPVAQVKQ